MYVSIVDIYLHFDFVVIFAAFLSVFFVNTGEINAFQAQRAERCAESARIVKAREETGWFWFFFPLQLEAVSGFYFQKEKKKTVSNYFKQTCQKMPDYICTIPVR